MFDKIRSLAPKAGIAVIEDLAEAGFITPVLYGGSLRDSFRRAAFNDLDIKTAVPYSTELSIQEIIASAENMIPKIRNLDVVDVKFLKDGSYGYSTSDNGPQQLLRLETIFTYAGKRWPTDIILLDKQTDVSNVVANGDATINAVAMDIQGNVDAHPDFESDIEDKFYTVLRSDKKAIMQSIKRFERLRDRFEGLELYLDPAYMGQTGFQFAVEHAERNDLPFGMP